jgi:hypothetical protein
MNNDKTNQKTDLENLFIRKIWEKVTTKEYQRLEEDILLKNQKLLKKERIKKIAILAPMILALVLPIIILGEAAFGGVYVIPPILLFSSSILENKKFSIFLEDRHGVL